MRRGSLSWSILSTGLFGISVCAGGAAAQVTVDPGGGGEFTQLQAAIDAVPPGTILRVVGGTYGPLTITKSLTILGDPAPTITSPPVPPGPTLPSAISLQGSGADQLVLSRVVITGTVDGFIFGSAQPAIGGSGFASVHVYDSTVRAPTWFNLTGTGSGTSAIGLPGATVVLARSDVRGADSETDGSGFGVPNGVPGISAETVIVLDSNVVGGGAGMSYFRFGPPQPTPCPCTAFGMFGYGGPGISATRLFDAGSTIQGGAGSPVQFSFPPGFTFWSWGRQPAGPPFEVTLHVTVESALFAFAPPELGSTFAVTVYPPAFGSGAVLVGRMGSAPMLFLGTWLFLDASALYGSFPTPPGQFDLSVPIPNVQALAGLSLSFQYVSSAGSLYNPIAAVIGF